MKKSHALPALSLTCCILFLSACSNFQFPGAYRIDIPQGNILQEKEVTQLKLGMTKEQVRYLLGSPLSGSDLRPSIWSYVYTHRKGNNLLANKRLDLTFNSNEKLINIEQ